MESGKMSCVKVITRFLSTNLLCLMFLTLPDCCGFIYPDSSQTDLFFHFDQTSELFSISLRLYITPPIGNPAGGERCVCVLRGEDRAFRDNGGSFYQLVNTLLLSHLEVPIKYVYNLPAFLLFNCASRRTRRFC